MFIGKYELDGKKYFSIYRKNEFDSYFEWFTNTFNCEDIETLDFTIKGKNYQEKKGCLKDIAIEWSNHFCQYSWSYGELCEINNYFYKNGKRYGLLRKFHENAIC